VLTGKALVAHLEHPTHLAHLSQWQAMRMPHAGMEICGHRIFAQPE
jgi:hypothetical protein